MKQILTSALATILVLVLGPGSMSALLLETASAQSSTPATQESVAEANKELVRQFFEVASSGDLADLSQLTTPDFVISTAPPGDAPDLQGLTETFVAARTGLPDFSIQIDGIIAEGDLVAVRSTVSGTHLGDFFGAAPTGRRIATQAMDLWRVEDGKLAENWHLEDILSVMEQLGAANATPVAAMPAATLNPAAAEPPGSRTDAAAMAANAELARRFRGELFAPDAGSVAAEILAPGVVWHADTAAIEPDDTAAIAVATSAAFPDLELRIEHVVAEGDRVAVLWTLSGTQQGEYLGVPPSGSQVVSPGMDFYRIDDGRIAEIWTVGDDLGLLMQIGAFAPFGAGSEATPVP